MKSKKDGEGEKKGGVIKREIASYKRYFMYRPSTPGIIGKRIKRSDFSKIVETYKNMKAPSITFKKSMEIEGIVDSDLKKAHKRLNILLWVMFFMSLYPLYYLVLTISNAVSGEGFMLGFLPSMFPSLMAMFVIGIQFLYISWHQWRIRNRYLIMPSDYMKVIASYPSQLVPVYGYRDNMERVYGKGWKKGEGSARGKLS